MKTYVYNLFNDPEIAVEDKQWEANRAAMGKSSRILLRSRFKSGRLRGLERRVRRPLACVRPGDKLYISAHGNVGFISFDNKKYTPEKLADHLQKSGLTKDFYDLRIASCYSGTEQRLLGVLHEDGHSLARRVKDAMSAVGYHRIRVTGYDGFYRPSQNLGLDNHPRFHSVIVLDNYVERASSHRVFES